MKATTTEQLVNFILAEGDTYSVTAKQVELVGIDRVLAGIDRQTVPVKVAGGYRYEVPADPTVRMEAYFAESFGGAFDMAYIGW